MSTYDAEGMTLRVGSIDFARGMLQMSTGGPLAKLHGGHVARLEDEARPDGAVLIQDASGATVAVMSREQWRDWQSLLVASGPIGDTLKALAEAIAPPRPKLMATLDWRPPQALNRHQRRAEAARKRRARP